jgi:copper chaperone
MTRLFAALVLSFALPTAALACGDAKCGKDGKAGCPMPTASADSPDALPAGTRATLTITGMSCGSCAAKVKSALTGVSGVKGAMVDATTGKATVSYDEKLTSPDKLVSAVNAGGHYTASVDG